MNRGTGLGTEEAAAEPAHRGEEEEGQECDWVACLGQLHEVETSSRPFTAEPGGGPRRLFEVAFTWERYRARLGGQGPGPAVRSLHVTGDLGC